MGINQRSMALVLVALGLVSGRPSVLAHTEMSAARLDTETRVRLGERDVAIECVLVLNRPAAYLEVLKMDTDQDGQLSPPEERRYFEQIRRQLLTGLEVTLNGVAATLESVGEVELSMPLTKRYRFSVEQPRDWRDGVLLELHNDCFLDARGSFTITVDPGDCADIVYSSKWQGARGEPLTSLTGLTSNGAQERDLLIRYRPGIGRERLEERAAATIPGRITASPVGSGSTAEFSRWGRVALCAALLALALVLRIAGRSMRETVGGRTVIGARVAVALVFLGVALFEIASLWRPAAAAPNDLTAGKIFLDLHRNIYRAFEARSEGEIYDVLVRSLDGDLLDAIYNEVHAALMSRESGAARFAIRRVKPMDTEILPVRPRVTSGYRVRHRWRVYGTVFHFGHRHGRINEYQALYTVSAAADGWRITDLRIEQQQRVDPTAGT